MTDEQIRIDLPQKMVQFCEDHWDELLFALVDRNLTDQIAHDSDALALKLNSGQMDPAMEAGTALTTTAIGVLGIDTVLQHAGCPVCAFNHVIELIADRMAMKYLEPH
jgi:hypothetical protein